MTVIVSNCFAPIGAKKNCKNAPICATIAFMKLRGQIPSFFAGRLRGGVAVVALVVAGVVAPAASESELQIRSAAQSFTARPASADHYVKEWRVDGNLHADCQGDTSVGTSDRAGGQRKTCVLPETTQPRDVRAIFAPVRKCAAENRAPASPPSVSECGACDQPGHSSPDDQSSCTVHNTAAAGTSSSFSQLLAFQRDHPDDFAVALTLRNAAGDTVLQSALTAAVASGANIDNKGALPFVVNLLINAGADVSLRTGSTARGTCAGGRWNLYQYVAKAGLLANNGYNGAFRPDAVHSDLRLTLLSRLGETGLDATRPDCSWGNANLPMRAAYWGFTELMTVLMRAPNKDLDYQSNSDAFPLWDVIGGRELNNFGDEAGFANLRLLLENGAGVGITKDGITPLDRLIQIHEATLAANPSEPFADNAEAAKILRDAGMACLKPDHSPALVTQFCPTNLVVSVVFTDPDNGEITAASAGAVVTSGGEIAPGRTVTLTATPDNGYFVRRWTGDCAEKGDVYDGETDPKTCELVRNTGGTFNAAAEFVPQTANASLVAEVKKSAPSLAEVRRILAAQDPSPDAEDDDSVPVLLIAAASLRAEIVSVLVTAGADVAQPHPTEHHAVPHMMIVNPLKTNPAACNDGDDTQLLRNIPKSLRVLRHFIDALKVADREADYNWNRTYGVGQNNLHVEKFFPWRFHHCVGNTATNDREAYIDMSRIIISIGRVCNAGPTNTEARILCQNHERLVNYPPDSELTGGRVLAFRVDRHGTETAIDPGGVTVDSRYSLRFTPQTFGDTFADWSADCAGTENDARCDIPRGHEDVNVGVTFRSAAAVAGIVAQVQSANPNLAAVRTHLRNGASPDTETGDGVPILLAAAANLHAEVVSVLVTAGADVVQGHPTESGAIPHMMAVIPLGPGGSDACDNGDDTQLGRSVPGSARVLKYFNDALVAANRESDYNWGAPYNYGAGLNRPVEQFLPWRFAQCIGNAVAADREAYIDISRILISRGRVCNAGGHTEARVLCDSERTVAFPEASQLTGGELSAVRVLADGTEIAFAAGATIDTRFSVRVSADPDSGRAPVWTNDCVATVPGDLRCDLPRGVNDLNVSVVFETADAAAAKRAGALLTLEIAKTVSGGPDPLSVAALLQSGASPNTEYPNGDRVIARAAQLQTDAPPDSRVRAQIVSILITAGADPNGRLAANDRTVPVLVAADSGSAERLESQHAILRHFIAAMGVRFAADPAAPEYDWTYASNIGNPLVVLRANCDTDLAPATCRQIADLFYERGSRCADDDDNPLCDRARDSVEVLATSAQTGNLHTVTARDFGRDTFDLALPDTQAVVAALAVGWDITEEIQNRPHQIIVSRNGLAEGDIVFTITATYKTSIVAREIEVEARVQSANRRPVRFQQPPFGGTLKAAAAGTELFNGDSRPVNQRIRFSAEPAAGYRVHQWTGDCKTIGQTGGWSSPDNWICEIPASTSTDAVSAGVVFARICNPPFAGFETNDCRLHPDVPPENLPIPSGHEARRAYCEAFSGTYIADQNQCRVSDEVFPVDPWRDVPPIDAMRTCTGVNSCNAVFQKWRECAAMGRSSRESGSSQCRWGCNGTAFGPLFGLVGNSQLHRILSYQYQCRLSDSDRFVDIPPQNRTVQIRPVAGGGQLVAVSQQGVTLTVGENLVFKSAGINLTANPDPDQYVLEWTGDCAASDAGDAQNLGDEKTCVLNPAFGNAAAGVVFRGAEGDQLVAELEKTAPSTVTVINLINAGASPDQASNTTGVPILHAVAKNASIAVALRADIVSLLVVAGANPNSRDTSNPATPRTVPHLLAANPPDGTGVPYSEALEVLKHFDNALARSDNADFVWWRDIQNTGTDPASPLEVLVGPYEDANLAAQSAAIEAMAVFIRSKGGTCQSIPVENIDYPVCLPPPASDNYHAFAIRGTAPAFNALAYALTAEPAAFAASVTTTYSNGNTPLQAALTAAANPNNSLANKPMLPAIVSLFVNNGANVNLFSGTTAGTGCANRWNLFEYLALHGLVANNAGGPYADGKDTTFSDLRLAVLQVLAEQTDLNATDPDCARGNTNLAHRAAYWGLDDLLQVILAARNKDLDATSNSDSFPLWDVVGGLNAGNYPTDATALSAMEDLVQAGANPTLTFNNGQTPMDRVVAINAANPSADPTKPFADNPTAARFLLSRGILCSPNNPDPLCLPPAQAPNFHEAAAAGTQAALVSITLYFNEDPLNFALSLAVTNAQGNTPLQSALTAAVDNANNLANRPALPALVSVLVATGAATDIFTGTTRGPNNCDNRRQWNLYQFVAAQGLTFGKNTTHSPLRLSVLAELGKTNLNASRPDCGQNNKQLLHSAADYGLLEFAEVLFAASNLNPDLKGASDSVLTVHPPFIHVISPGFHNGNYADADEVVAMLSLFAEWQGPDGERADLNIQNALGRTALDRLVQIKDNTNVAAGAQTVADFLIAKGVACPSENHATLCPSRIRLFFQAPQNGRMAAAAGGTGVEANADPTQPSGDPAGYVVGTRFRFTARPTQNHFVVRWTGGCAGTQSSHGVISAAVATTHADTAQKVCEIEPVVPGILSVGVVIAPSDINTQLIAQVHNAFPSHVTVLQFLDLTADPGFIAPGGAPYHNRNILQETAIRFGLDSADYPASERPQIIRTLLTAGAHPRRGGRDFPIQIGRNSQTNEEGLRLNIRMFQNFVVGIADRRAAVPDAPDYDWNYSHDTGRALDWVRVYCTRNHLALCRELAAVMYEHGSRCNSSTDILCQLPAETNETTVPLGHNTAVTVITARDLGSAMFSLSVPTGNALSLLADEGWAVTRITTSRPWQVVVGRNKPAEASYERGIFTVTAFNGTDPVREYRMNLAVPPPAEPNFHDLAAEGTTLALAQMQAFKNDPAVPDFRLGEILVQTNDDGNTPLQSALTAAVAAGNNPRHGMPAIVDFLINNGANVSLFTGTTNGGDGRCNGERWNFYDYVVLSGLLNNTNNSDLGDFTKDTVHSDLRISLLVRLGQTNLDISRSDCEWGNATTQIRASYHGLAKLMSVMVQAQNKNLDRKNPSNGTFPLYDVVNGRHDNKNDNDDAVAIIRTLLNAGASVETRNNQGRTPLDRIADTTPFTDDDAVVELLQTAGMRCAHHTYATHPDVCPPPLVNYHTAAAEGDADAFAALNFYAERQNDIFRASVAITNAAGHTPLESALTAAVAAGNNPRHGLPGIVSLFIANGANTNRFPAVVRGPATCDNNRQWNYFQYVAKSGNTHGTGYEMRQDPPPMRVSVLAQLARSPALEANRGDCGRTGGTFLGQEAAYWGAVGVLSAIATAQKKNLNAKETQGGNYVLRDVVFGLADGRYANKGGGDAAARMIELLLGGGANPALQNNAGQTALDALVTKKTDTDVADHANRIAALLRAVADANGTNACNQQSSDTLCSGTLTTTPTVDHATITRGITTCNHETELLIPTAGTAGTCIPRNGNIAANADNCEKLAGYADIENGDNACDFGFTDEVKCVYPGQNSLVNLCTDAIFTAVRDCFKANKRLATGVGGVVTCGEVCPEGMQPQRARCRSAGVVTEPPDSAASCTEITERPDPDWDGTGTQTCVCLQGFFRAPSGSSVGECVPRQGWVRLGDTVCNPDQILLPNGNGTGGTCFSRSANPPANADTCTALAGANKGTAGTNSHHCEGLFSQNTGWDCWYYSGTTFPCNTNFNNALNCNKANRILRYRAPGNNAAQPCGGGCGSDRQAVGRHCRDASGIAPACASDEVLKDGECAPLSDESAALLAEIVKSSPDQAVLLSAVAGGADPNLSVLNPPAWGANRSGTCANCPLLVYAAGRGFADLVSVLITAGANPEVRDSSNFNRYIPSVMTFNPGGGNGLPYATALEVLRHYSDGLDVRRAAAGGAVVEWWNFVGRDDQPAERSLDALPGRFAEFPAQQSVIRQMSQFIRGKGGTCGANHPQATHEMCDGTNP